MRAAKHDVPWFPGLVLAALVFTAVFASYLAPHSPTAGDITQKLIPPLWMGRGEWEHPLGTDRFGRGVLSRIIRRRRVSLIVSLIATGAGGPIGTPPGLSSGHRGGLT